MEIEAPSLGSEQTQRILRLYNLYRLLIGLTLVLVISSDLDSQLLEVAQPQLLRYGSWLYLLFNALLAGLAPRPRHLAQVFALALGDILLLSVLFYAAGGIPSGIGNLLIIAVAIANILLRGRVGLLLAAVAAIGLIYLTLYLGLSRNESSSDYVQAGALGALCFAAALFVQGLARRLHASERLARQRADDVANLEELNEQILQRMRTGILVLDNQRRVLLANQGACVLIGQDNLVGRIIDPYFPTLVECQQQWQGNPTQRPTNLHARPGGPTLQPTFVSLQKGLQQHTLVFLDDISQIAQQAQQLKLAALGRLTAGIAHEIRNPLGAISHAAQLLQESEDLQGPDQRLLQIIQDQSRRMNLVIENVLQLSRRRQTEAQLLDLKYWLHRFAGEFRSTLPAHQQLHVSTPAGSLHTRMDPNHLTQVLTNLVQNGLRYSAQKNAQGQVWLNLYRDNDSGLPVLEVFDDGPGVSADQVANLFEPFHTTENKGTGLGLYISRELCESNQARLDYCPWKAGGSCFRITFAHSRQPS